MKSGEILLGTFRLDAEAGTLTDLEGNRLPLRHQSLRVLALMAHRPGETVSKAEFIDTIWDGRAVSDDSLAHCIAEIRAALGDSRRRIVQTVPRKGYRLRLPEPRGTRPIRAAVVAGVAAVLVTLAAIAVVLWPRASPAARPVVAVLRFDDLSAGPHRGYLSDAISEGILTNLARYPEMTVIAASSSFGLSGSGQDLAGIARALKADYVLEGSQQFDGQTLRVAMRLIDTADSSQIWADSLDSDLGALFDANAAISARAADSVSARLVDLSESRHQAGQATSALLLENRARRLIHQSLTRNNWEAGQALLDQALREFPRSAWSHLGMAMSLRNGVRFGWIDGPVEPVLQRALDHAHRGVELDPDNYMARYALGRVHMQRGDLERAISELRISAALNPSSVATLEALGQPFLYLGQPDEVLRIVAQANRIDPISGRVSLWLEAWARWQLGQCEAALATHRRMTQPPVESFKLLAAIHACLDDADTARAVLATYLSAFPDWSVARERTLHETIWRDGPSFRRWLDDLREAGLPEG